MHVVFLDLADTGSLHTFTNTRRFVGQNLIKLCVCACVCVCAGWTWAPSFECVSTCKPQLGDVIWFAERNGSFHMTGLKDHWRKVVPVSLTALCMCVWVCVGAGCGCLLVCTHLHVFICFTKYTADTWAFVSVSSCTVEIERCWSLLCGWTNQCAAFIPLFLVLNKTYLGKFTWK